MSKQRGKPTLYEHLVRKNREDGGLPPSAPVPEPVSPVGPSSGGADLAGLLRGGRTVRLPVGYLLVGATLAILLVVIAYSVGYSGGKRDQIAAHQRDLDALTENERIANELARGTDSGTGERVTPPTPPNRGDRTDGTNRTGGNQTGSGNQSNLPVGGNNQPRNPGPAVRPIETDPREAGLNYFYLVTTSHENAVRVAEFCRRYGVEAYVVRANNLSRVLAVPGFRPEDDGLRQRVETDIRRVKEAWRQEVGRDEIGLSPERYRG